MSRHEAKTVRQKKRRVLFTSIDVKSSIMPSTLAAPQLAAAAKSNKLLSNSTDIFVRTFHTGQSVRLILSEVLDLFPDFVGFSLFLWNEQMVRFVVRALKALRPNTFICLGGAQVQGREVLLMNELPEIDLIVTGDGEHVVSEILSRQQRQVALEGIAGTTVRTKEGGLVTTSLQTLTSIAQLDHLPSAYLSETITPNDVVYIGTSRGCTMRCAYCDVGSQKKRLLLRELDVVFDELAHVRGKGAHSIAFIDSLFNHNTARAVQILTEAKRLGFEAISAQIKAEKLNEEFVQAFSQFRSIAGIGLQSTNDTVCNLAGRKNNWARFKAGIELLQRYEVTYKIHLICGLPGDTFETFCASLDDALSLGPATVEAFALQVLPGTRFFEQAETLGLLFDRDPPHEIYATQTMSFDQIMRIRLMSSTAFKLHNRYRAHVGELVQFGCRPSMVYLKTGERIIQDGVTTLDEWMDPRAKISKEQSKMINKCFLESLKELHERC